MTPAAVRTGPVIVAENERLSLVLLNFGDCERLIAATELVRDMAVVARNVRDCADTGVSVRNPWQP